MDTDKHLTYLNLSNNILKDKFAMALINGLKRNRNVHKILLENNIIELKYLYSIAKILEINKGYIKKEILPKYRREYEKVQINPESFGITEQEIAKVNSEFNKEEQVVNKASIQLTNVKTIFKSMSNETEKKKKKVEEEFKNTEKEIKNAEEINTNITNEKEKEIVEINKKIEGANRAMSRVEEDRKE